METRFRDRADAGRRLAARLAHLRAENPVVIGLAQGGAVVAAEVAPAVGAELEILAVRRGSSGERPEIGRHGAARPESDLSGRTVVIVDDGLASGMTAEAAATYARKGGAARIVVAAPICSPGAARRLRGAVDEVLCLCSPEVFRSVGQAYEAFEPVTDAAVAALANGRYMA